MKFYLPTREECQEIVKNSDAFYVTETEVNGYKVEMYDYRLASISDFTDNNAFELRGLTFVYNPSSDKWERHILMNKFFNINQTIGWMQEDVQNKKIVRVQDKLDGSVISFVRFPDGTVRAKSKMSFISDQAMMAQELYENNGSLRVFVNEELDKGYVPIFELVSPDNQIVLEYNKTDLVLLQIRDIDGTYLSETYKFSRCSKFNVSTSMKYPSGYNDLNELLKLKETEEGIEGWVVTFEDGQMAKIKTDWYLQLHGLVGPDEFRENLLVQTILNDNIDDVISALVPGVKKDKIVNLTELVQHKFNLLVIEYKELRRKYFNDFNEDRKAFAMKYKSYPLFGYVMKRLNTSFTEVEKVAEESVKEYMLNECKTLSSAKEFIGKL